MHFEGDLLVRVSKGLPRYIEGGEVFHQKKARPDNLEEVDVLVYGTPVPNVIEDKNYSLPTFRRLVGNFSCKFVRLKASAIPKHESEFVDVAVNRLMGMTTCKVVAVIEVGRIYIGSDDNSTAEMIHSFKAIFSDIADRDMGLSGDVAIWWHLNEVEYAYLKEHEDVLPSGAKFISDCSSLVVM